MRALGLAEKPAVAIKLLHKAEALTDPRGVMYRHPRRHSLRAVTLNNLGCYYKEQRKYHTALSYLQRALKLEADGALLAAREPRPAPPQRRSPQPRRAAGLRDNPAGTHLNMCAILSHMHRCAPARAPLPAGSEGPLTASLLRSHREALQHSKLALEMVLLDEEEKEEAGVQHEAATQLTDVMREHASASDDTPAAEGQGQAPGTEQGAAGGEGEGAAAGEGEEGEGEGKEEDTSLLAIAYFNMAVQHEHLHELDLALGAYDSAVGAAERDLGSEHPMTEGMRRTLEAVERTARKAAASGGGRRSPRNSPRGLPSATVFDRLSARYNPPAERDVLGSPRSPRGSPRGGVGADSFNTARTQRRSPRGGAQPATTRRVTNSTTAAGASAVR